MPVTRISPDPDAEYSDAEYSDAEYSDGEYSNKGNSDINLDVFHVQETFEVYDGVLALPIDHLLNHIKVLITLAYLPGSADLERALKRHPVLRRKLRKLKVDAGETVLSDPDGRSVERVLLAECQRLLDGVLEIAHLSAWPETAGQAQTELDILLREVPFLDYRYDNDPFPSDRDHEERG